MLLHARLVLLLALVWVGCAAAPPPEPAQGPAAPVEAAAPNRDRHGPSDVDRYIHELQREERVRELDPEGVIRALGLPQGAVVADVGCGPGVLSLPLARHLSEGLVYAVDVEPRQLDALRAHVREQGLDNVVPVLASYSDPHLPPAAVDWIFVVDTYHHLESRVPYLRGLAADLAPGGEIVILEYKPGDLPVGPPADHKIPLDARHAELREAGFELRERFDRHRYHDFEVWRRTDDP